MSERLTIDEAERLASELATLGQAGLPLDQGLRAAADELGRGRLANTMRDLARRLEQGSSLAEVVASRTQMFPKFLAGVLEMAASSGRLETVLPRLVEQFELGREQSRQLRGALAYPLVVLTTLLAIYVAISFAVAPGLIELMREFELKLPAWTNVVIWWNEIGIFWGLGLAASMVVVLLFVRLMVGAASWQAAMIHLPLVGPAWHWAATARMARGMAMLMDLQRPLPEALRLTSAGVRDANLANVCQRLATMVERGTPLSMAVAADRGLPAVVMPLLQSGEQSGSQAAAWLSVAELMERWVAIRASLLRQLLPPIVFLFVAAAVMNLFLSFMTPLIELVNNLS